MGRAPKSARGSQRALILNHLESGRTLSASQAWNWWKIQRLAPRIYELRQEGCPIVTVLKGQGMNRHAVYQLS